MKYKSIPVNEVSYFFISEGCPFLKCFSGRIYAIDYSLDRLQKMMNPDEFFRINRNYLVSLHSVDEMVSYSSNRLQLRLKHEEKSDDFVVSRDKVSDFKKWVDR